MTFKELEDLVNAAKAEDWDKVDDVILDICNDPAYINWAYGTGVEDQDGNVRDLAVSILEKANIPEDQLVEIRAKLYGLMKSDANKYVRFRSAFALAAYHQKDNPEEHKDEVIAVLREATGDEDTSEFAHNYLKKLDSEQ